MARSGALAHINDEEILARIQDGEHPSAIAHELGVHKSAIYHRYSHRPDYQQAREHGTAVRIDEVEEEIRLAPDAFTLARARERGRIVLWRAEREHAGRWGQKTETKVEASITVTVKRIGETYEAEPVADIPNAAAHPAISAVSDPDDKA